MARRGFSLLEIVIVVVIIAILVGIGVALMGPNIDMNKASYQVRLLADYVNSIKNRAAANAPNVARWSTPDSFQDANDVLLRVANFDDVWQRYDNSNLAGVFALKVSDITRESGNLEIHAVLDSTFNFDSYPYFSANAYQNPNEYFFLTQGEVPAGLTPELHLPADDNIIDPNDPNNSVGEVEKLRASIQNVGGGEVIFNITGDPRPAEQAIDAVYMGGVSLSEIGTLSVSIPSFSSERYGAPSYVLIFKLRDMPDDNVPILFITTKGKMFPCGAVRFVTSVDNPRSFPSKHVFGIMIAPTLSFEPQPNWFANSILLTDGATPPAPEPAAALCIFDQVGYSTLFYNND